MTRFPLHMFRARCWVYLLCLLGAGCSAIRLGYSHADTLLLAGLNRYFDLDKDQESWARDRIESLLVWHRATQLRDYADLLRSIRAQVRGPVTAEQALTLGNQLRARLNVLGDRLAPDIADLAAQLQPRQLARMQARWAEEQEDARDVGGENEDIGEHGRRFTDQAEFWLGDLTPAQEALVRAGFAGTSGLDARRERERAQRRTDWLALLERLRADRPPAAEGAARVRAWFGALADPPEPIRQAETAGLRRDTATLTAALLQAATPDQRAHLDARLSGLAEDLTALADEGRTEPAAPGQRVTMPARAATTVPNCNHPSAGMTPYCR